jgi:hypothetical protein
MRHANFNQVDHTVVGVRPAFEEPLVEPTPKVYQLLLVIAVVVLVVQAMIWAGHEIYQGEVWLWHTVKALL